MHPIIWIVPALALLGVACGSSQPRSEELGREAPAATAEPAPAETAEPAPAYPPEVRESFMNECVVSAEEDACSCVLAKIEANISIEDLSAGNYEHDTIEGWTVECLEELGRDDRPPE